MKTTLQIATALVLATCIGAFAADDAPKKTRKAPASLADRTIKKYQAAGLTEEQTAKIKELATAAEKKIADLRAASALTDAQKEAQKTALKAAKEAGKEKKELRDAVNAAVKLTDPQQAAQKQIRSVNQEFGKAAQAVLTDDQKAKLKAAASAKPKPEKKPTPEKKPEKKPNPEKKPTTEKKPKTDS